MDTDSKANDKSNKKLCYNFLCIYKDIGECKKYYCYNCCCKDCRCCKHYNECDM